VSRWPYHVVSRNMLTIENQSARRRGLNMSQACIGAVSTSNAREQQ